MPRFVVKAKVNVAYLYFTLYLMRNIFILLFILGGFHAALAQKSNTTPVITRYYYFTGTIDKYPVTFHLYRINNEFSGSYYYNSTEEAIYISGELGKDRFLKLTRTNRGGKEPEVLSGNFKDSSFSGTWSYKGKLLPFRAAQPKDNNGLTFDYIYTHGEKKLPVKQEFNRTEIVYDAATIWPSPSSKQPAANLIKQIIFEAFGEKEAQGEIGKLMIKEKNETLNPAKKEDEPIDYYLGRKIQVAYRNQQLLTISNFLYIDGGGAHGNYGISYSCIDLVHNRKLQITDVLDTLACRKTLQTLLAKKFRSDYKGSEDEADADIFKDAIELTTNFSLTSKGIGFNYDPYEIGPYAMGNVSIYIPFKELESCLKPEFKQLTGIISQ